MVSRVLFVTDYLHVPQGGGGAERNTHELCLALLAQNVHPAVSCDLRVDGSWLSRSSRIRRKLHARHEFSRDDRCGYPVFRGWDHSRVGEVVHRFKPDVVVVQSTHPEPLLRALAPSGVPVVVYFHEVEQIEHLRFLRELGIPVLANSGFTAARLQEVCGLSCDIVLPLIDPKHYATQMHPERVLFINTTARKGADLAFSIAETRPDIPFTFVLSWTHKPLPLAALRARALAAGNIILHPPTQDMRPLYARTKILLAPSQWEEAWGRVATEAHVNGIPVLGSDRGGLPQAIGPGGIIVPASAPKEDWVAALSRMWDDPDEYALASDAARVYSTRMEIQPAAITATLREAIKRAVPVDVSFWHDAR